MKAQTQEGGLCEKKAVTCTSLASQYADVCLPLTIQPYAIVGDLVTECCGEPLVALRSCQGASGSCGCELVITQNICIKIPIEYGAEAARGELTACCKRPNGSGGCNPCR